MANSLLDSYLNTIKNDYKLITDSCSMIGDYKGGVWSGKSANKAKLYFDEYNTKYNALIGKLNNLPRLNYLVAEYNKIANQKNTLDHQQRTKYSLTLTTNYLNNPSYNARVTSELNALASKAQQLNTTLQSYETELNNLVGW